MSFQEFCLTHAVSNETSDFKDINPNQTVDIHCMRAINSMIAIMINKVDIFDKINTPGFIDKVLNNPIHVSLLEEKYADGEIPEGIICELSKGIFKKEPSSLNDKQAAIIKVLTAYICIQI